MKRTSGGYNTFAVQKRKDKLNRKVRISLRKGLSQGITCKVPWRIDHATTGEGEGTEVIKMRSAAPSICDGDFVRVCVCVFGKESMGHARPCSPLVYLEGCANITAFS